MGDSVTPEVEVLSNMIRQYFSQERSEEEPYEPLIICAGCCMRSALLHRSLWTVCCG